MSILKVKAEVGKYDPYTRSVPVVASVPHPTQGEAITKWDLSRFMKNPVVLWAHNTFCVPVGRAKEIEWVPAEGLKMRIYFASEKANPLAEQLANAVAEEIQRAVSVGYEPAHAEPITLPDGTVLPPRDTPLLCEVSFVPVGMDEDAGTPALNPDAVLDDETMAARVSYAAGEMARARARKRAKAAKENALPQTRTDSNDNEDVLRVDTHRLGKVERTSLGGAKIPARLARTGILEYRNADGSLRRELRLEEEVFNGDSLKTLDHVPVIDIKDHTGLVTPDTWRKVSLGHVTQVRRDGKYIASDLIVQDAETLDAIEDGSRTEISCGYVCRLDMSPGEWQGQKYDCIQRNIRYNHAALCPPNRGRAGPEVGLRFDSNSQAWAVSHPEEEEIAMKTIRLDGKDYEIGSKEHLDKVDEMHKEEIKRLQTEHQTRLDAANTSVEAEKKRAVKLEAERDGLKADLDKFNADAKKAKEDDEKKAKEEEKAREQKRRFRRRLERTVSLFQRAFGKDEDDEEEDDEEDEDKKMDAIDAKSDRDLMVECIAMTDEKFDAKDKTDDYVQARFDAEAAKLPQAIKDKSGVDSIVRTVEENKRRLDANDGAGPNDPIAKARAARDKATFDAWKTPPKTA